MQQLFGLLSRRLCHFLLLQIFAPMVEVNKFDTIVRYDLQLLSHVLVELVGVLIADLVVETRLH